MNFLSIEMVATFTALYGSYLVAMRERKGFIFFMLANVAWITFDIQNGHWFQLFMFTCFFGTAWLGWKNWKEGGKRNAK